MQKRNENINCISLEYNSLDLYIEKRIDVYNGGFGYKWIRTWRKEWLKHNNNINNSFLDWSKFLVKKYLINAEILNKALYTVGHYDNKVKENEQYEKQQYIDNMSIKQVLNEFYYYGSESDFTNLDCPYLESFIIFSFDFQDKISTAIIKEFYTDLKNGNTFTEFLAYKLKGLELLNELYQFSVLYNKSRLSPILKKRYKESLMKVWDYLID
jgi:hypothetical protein